MIVRCGVASSKVGKTPNCLSLRAMPCSVRRWCLIQVEELSAKALMPLPFLRQRVQSQRCSRPSTVSFPYLQIHDLLLSNDFPPDTVLGAVDVLSVESDFVTTVNQHLTMMEYTLLNRFIRQINEGIFIVKSRITSSWNCRAAAAAGFN